MKVKFVPQNVEFEIESGKCVMALAHEKGIPIKSTCNGLPSCAECRVRIVDGDWNTNPPSRKELNLIGTGYYIDQRRLSCQLLCFGDITVDTSEQIEKVGEGPITKKFLSKVHKTSAEESHSLGGVLIEQDEALFQQLKNDVPNAPDAAADESPRERTAQPRDQDRPAHRPQGPQASGGSQQASGDSQRSGEGQRRRRRRGGRNRNNRRGERSGGPQN